MQQASLMTPESPKAVSSDEALAMIDQALLSAMPIEPPTPVTGPLAARLADLFTLRLMSVAIQSPTSVSLTVCIEGGFAPPGNRVTVGPTTVVVTVPATVLPVG